ncbi:kinase-like domain-containing protein [Rhizophagus irregularis DAOM 181602=DAOM 197198]|nr:kinase-like domain-containing protein [Rhizophagus irregularis DAOM 181602=DAOM 197198]
MSNNTESNIPVNFTENSNNEWINWIEEAIAKDYFKYYELNHFSNFQEIGFGGFGKVYRANWKSSPNYLALKSFFNFNNVTIKEIVKELKIQREVDFHENIIRFCGIATENQVDNSKKYWLVMEYANGGTLREYLKEHFDNLTWNNKFNMAFQLACAILCLHDEGIIHRDLHSKNVLVHQNIVKLADFGKPYDVCLAINISQGLRETPIPDTPEDYVNIYTDCWNNEPDNRPTINQVVFKLNAIILKNNNNMIIKDFRANDSYTNQLSSKQQLDLNAFEDPINNSSHGELSKFIQEFNKMNTKEIDSSISSNNNFKLKENIQME